MDQHVFTFHTLFSCVDCRYGRETGCADKPNALKDVADKFGTWFVVVGEWLARAAGKEYVS